MASPVCIYYAGLSQMDRQMRGQTAQVDRYMHLLPTGVQTCKNEFKTLFKTIMSNYSTFKQCIFLHLCSVLTFYLNHTVVEHDQTLQLL